MSLSVLHVVTWYPTPQDTLKGIFVKRHIDALRPYCDNTVLHLEAFFYGDKFIRRRRQQLPDGTQSYTYQLRGKHWRVAELLTAWLLFRELVLKRKARHADIINLYIAYPSGLFTGLLRLFIRKPIVFTEQWSAYHFNFHAGENAPGLERIRKIFRKKIPLITVSAALGEDIRRFSRQPQLPFEVVPNAVDTQVFFPRNLHPPAAPVFFMVNRWSGIKDPMPVLEAFTGVLEAFPAAKLRIGGTGDRLAAMEGFVAEHGLQNAVVFLGQLAPQHVSEELNACTALLQPTRYETFSVICAEALCCGTPVAASDTGALPGLVNASNGLLVRKNDAQHWREAMISIAQQQDSYRRAAIAADAQQKFSPAAVGEAYFRVLKRFAGNA